MFFSTTTKNELLSKSRKDINNKKGTWELCDSVAYGRATATCTATNRGNRAGGIRRRCAATPADRFLRWELAGLATRFLFFVARLLFCSPGTGEVVVRFASRRRKEMALAAAAAPAIRVKVPSSRAAVNGIRRAEVNGVVRGRSADIARGFIGRAREGLARSAVSSASSWHVLSYFCLQLKS